MSYAEDLHHFPRVKFCFRLGVGEGVNVNCPASFRKCITPNKLNDLMYHHVTPQMIKKKTQPIKIYFYLTCALYWNDRIWDITRSSCAVGAHSIAVI